MYVTPILLLLLASNAFADGAKDWQERFSNVGINTKETSCVVKDLKMNLDTLLSMANEQQNEINPAASNEANMVLTPLTDGCPTYFVSSGHSTFNFALNFCRTYGMKLATPDTPKKMDCIKTLMIQAKMDSDYWIAASDENHPIYIWKTTNQPADMLPYWDKHNRQPNGPPEHCAFIRSENGLVHDYKCGNGQRFLCETI